MPKSCPLPALSYESNSMLMKYRVYSKIINFVKHMHSQEKDSSNRRQIIDNQIINDSPGLIKVPVSICVELKLSWLLDSQISNK